MESWKLVWRKGIASLLSLAGLSALLKGLKEDDQRIIQGATTTPPPLQCVQDWPVEAACALGYCGWQGEGLESVAEVEEFFARMCFEIDSRLGEPAGCRWFLNWFDETPREEMRMSLASEVMAELYHRSGCHQEALDVILKYPSAPMFVWADMLDDAGFDVAARAMRAISAASSMPASPAQPFSV